MPHSADRLERSPLIYVLVQVRFPPLLKMEELVPQIQERLRKSGYPRHEAEKVQHVALNPDGELKSGAMMRWVFRNRKESSAVILAKDFFVFETNDYGVYDEFTERLAPIVEILADVLDVEFCTRIGLRYVDLIRELDGNGPDWFVSSGLKGLTRDAIGTGDVQNQCVATAKTNEGEIRIRSVQARGPVFLPPDLESDHLRFTETPKEGEPVRILDIDHFSNSEFDFRSDAIIERMTQLKQTISKTFKASVTPEALDIWRHSHAAEQSH